MKIEDGKGKNGDMSVSSTQRGNVSAKTAPRAMYSSRDDGLAYAAVAHSTIGVVGEYALYIKNTSSTRNMFVGDLSCGGVNAVLWKIWFVTGTATGGAAVVSTPMNKSKSIAAEVTVLEDNGGTVIGGLTQDGELYTMRSGAADRTEEGFHGALILGPGDAIALEYDTGTVGVCEAAVHFHYETIGAS